METEKKIETVECPEEQTKPEVETTEVEDEPKQKIPIETNMLKLPMEMIQNILSYTSIWDVFQTRQTCKALLQQITKEFVKKKWAKDKKILETKLLQNRGDIVWALGLARVVIDSRKQSIKMNGDKERLLSKLKENEKLEEEAW